MRKKLFLLLSTFEILFIATACKSQTTARLPFEKKIGPDNGLSSYNVNKILQDKFGFMWIATQDGLNRYDGNEFTTYNKSTTIDHRLLGNVINDIVEDTAKNILWVTTTYGGINGIDLITGNIVYVLQCVITDSGFHNGWLRCFNICNSNLWIGSFNGLTVYNPSASRFIKIDPLPFITNSIFNQLNINAVLVDQYDHVWIFLPDYGLVVYSGLTNKILRYYTCRELGIHETQGYVEYLCRFAKINNQSFVLGTDHGFDFFTYDSLGNVKIRDEQNSSLNRFFKNSLIQSCAVDENGELWFSTLNYLYKYNLKSNIFEIISDIGKEEQSTWLNSIFYIFFDKQNNLWLGTEKGITFCRNTESPFIPYFKSKDGFLRINHANYLYALNDSIVYVCAVNGFYEVNTLSDNILLEGSNSIYYYVFRNIDNKIIVSADNGLFIYESKKMNSIEHEYPELAGIKKEIITSSIILGDSMVIMGSTTGKGIYLWKSKKHLLQNITMTNDNIESTKTNNLYKDSQNQIWVLFFNSIAIFDINRHNYKRFQINDPDLKIPLSIFFDICEVNNYYWMAVYGKGIIQIDKNYKIKKIYSLSDGLLNTGVYKILPYKDSLLFITSNKGLFCLDIKLQKIHQYLKDDGLNTNNFEENCGYIKNDIFYAGGENGFSIIKPALIKNQNSVPLIYIDRLKFQFQNNSLDTFNLHFQKYAIPNNTLQTTISFSSLNYMNPGRVNYAYKIDEIDNNWLSLGTQNFVNLIGLSPDTYTLEVKAANEDGIWCEPKTLTLTFLPKWYQTAWFKAAIILAVGGLFYSFYRYRISQLKKQQQIRHEIANDLHDDLGATLNSIRIFTRLAETSPQKEEYFKQIKESLNHAYSGLRDMIWVLDDTGDTVEDLLKRIKQFAEPVAHANNIHVHFSSVDSNNIDLNKTEKRNLLLIAKEGITNCIKYAGCKNIYVSLTVTDGKIALITQDDGCGFNEKEIIPGHGLKNIMERAKQIHYTASIKSTKDEGTKIVVVKK